MEAEIKFAGKFRHGARNMDKMGYLISITISACASMESTQSLSTLQPKMIVRVISVQSAN